MRSEGVCYKINYPGGYSNPRVVANSYKKGIRGDMKNTAKKVGTSIEHSLHVSEYRYRRLLEAAQEWMYEMH
jgi:hypothetical protein